MIRARLSLLEAGSSDPTADGADWGTWDFASLPRAGDVRHGEVNAVSTNRASVRMGSKANTGMKLLDNMD